MDYISVLVGLLLGIALGLFIARSFKGFSKGHIEDELVYEQLQKRVGSLEEKLDKERQENKEHIASLATAKQKHRDLEEKLLKQKDDLAEINEQFENKFKLLANKILEEKSDRFTKQNKDNMENILLPLKDRLKEFENKVEKTYQEGNKDRVSLKTEINNLMSLNKQLSEEAHNLTVALKGDSKIQGDWGEYQLELILEKAGLKRGIHFTTQDSYRDDEGMLKRPDFLIKLPEDKVLVIDSKVSLKAYEKFTSSEDEDSKSRYLKEHISSLRQHLKDLSGKRYQELYEISTPDYVLMYIPIEPALHLALQEVDKLFFEALEKNIVIVSTSTLLATMKTVSFIWTQELQRENVRKIAEQGSRLYDKFVGFTDDLIKVGKQLDLAKSNYDGAMNKLSTGKGNLVRQSEKMKALMHVKKEKAVNPILINDSQEEDNLSNAKNDE